MMAMSTDGFITVYNIALMDSSDFESAKISRHRERLHKSGINSFDILKIDNDKFLLATGGDDNAINLLLLKLNEFEEKSFIDVISKSYYDNFHSCQVTGELSLRVLIFVLKITFVRYTYFDVLGLKFGRVGQLYSIGVDQVINRYDYSDGPTNVLLCEQLKTPISDAQGLELWVNEK